MSDAAASDEGRRYGGASAAERRAERRERLIRAAIALFGEQGYRNTTVAMVCRAAGLTPRYFYEAFENSEALLAETFREVSGFVAQHVEAAAAAVTGPPDVRLAALLTAYYDLLRQDPAGARVFLSEVSGIDGRVDQLFAGSMEAFAILIARTLDPSHDAGQIEPLTKVGSMHGLLAIARAWVADGCATSVDDVVRIAIPLCLLLQDGKSTFSAPLA